MPLMDAPIAMSTAMALTIERGIAVTLIAASRPDRRNATRTAMTSSDPIAIARATLRTDVSTNDACREIGGSRRAPTGNARSSSWSAASTCRVTVRVSAHGNFATCT